MAVCRASARLCALLALLSLYTVVILGERHGDDAEYITLRREKRSGPIVVNVDEGTVEKVEGKEEKFSFQHGDNHPTRTKRNVLGDKVIMPQVNVVSNDE